MTDLRSEARSTDERRAIVLHGDRDTCYETVQTILETGEVSRDTVTVVGNRDILNCERVGPRQAATLLGRTRSAIVLDWHDTCRPNALGQVVGTIAGGGLLVIVAPPLETWETTMDAFHETLAVPPVSRGEVGHRYHERVVELLYAHRGIAVVDVDTGEIECDGLTNPPPKGIQSKPSPPDSHAFPVTAYNACRTDDQVTAVHALERLKTPGTAVVVEADRGRGKSSAAGLAAACLAIEGETVVVTAPDRTRTASLFERAEALLTELDAVNEHHDGEITTQSGGRITFSEPDAVAEIHDLDVLIVDEAAGLSVRQLTLYLSVERVAFVTTVHGYEGAGRGFDIRFRNHLDDSGHDIVDVSLATPIRYAANDPIEVWAFHTLLLNARPTVDPLVTDATPGTVTYQVLTPDDLSRDERLLRESFGLLIAAHYRTEPDDLARLLDAPNISVRALLYDDHVVAVALLAKEGGLDATTREWMYDGGRISGNMLPDVFASQLRDPDAAAPQGWRILRIATHPAVRSRGLGSRLLGHIRAEANATTIDWLGVSYGATPELLSFWDQNGFSTVHLATTRTRESGEYSALMLLPLSDAGQAVHDRLGTWFLERIPGVFGDALRDADPDVVRAALAACGVTPTMSLSNRDWRVVAGAAYGPGQYDVDPEPFKRIAVEHLVDRTASLSDREERLLVRKVLQSQSWSRVASELGYHSPRECMRSLGDAYKTLCTEYGGVIAAEIRDRYAE